MARSCTCPPTSTLAPTPVQTGTYSCRWSNAGCTPTNIQCNTGFFPGSSCTSPSLNNYTACTNFEANNGAFPCVAETAPPGSQSLDLDQLYGIIQRYSAPFNMQDPIGSIVTALLTYIFPIAGLVLLLYLIYGGYNMMLSAGDPKKAAMAKSIITTALIGFTIIFASYWIVKIVGSVLGLGFSSIF